MAQSGSASGSSTKPRRGDRPFGSNRTLHPYERRLLDADPGLLTEPLREVLGETVDLAIQCRHVGLVSQGSRDERQGAVDIGARLRIAANAQSQLQQSP